jgi:hypothetical protein
MKRHCDDRLESHLITDTGKVGFARPPPENVEEYKTIGTTMDLFTQKSAGYRSR